MYNYFIFSFKNPIGLLEMDLQLAPLNTFLLYRALPCIYNPHVNCIRTIPLTVVRLSNAMHRNNNKMKRKNR